MTIDTPLLQPDTLPPAQELEQAIKKVMQFAVVHHQSDQFQEAEALYRAILQIQPNHLDAKHNLGLLIQNASQRLAHEHQQGLQGEAAENLTEGLEAHTQIKAQLKATRSAKQVKKKGTHADRVYAPDADEINSLIALYHQGKTIEVEALSRSLTTRFPLNATGWRVLGTVLHNQGRVAEALLCMQKTASFLPRDPIGHNNLGITLKDLGRFIESEVSLRRALALKPDYAEAHNNLGVTLKDLGRLAEAEVSLRQALALTPDYAEAHNNLGLTLNDLGRLVEAEVSLRQALALKPDLAEAHSNLGNTLKGLGRTAESESSLRKALELKPYFAEALNNLSLIQIREGRLAEAETSLRKALELKPYFAEAHSNMGLTLCELGLFSEAETSLRRALALKPDLAEAHNNLGHTLQNRNHTMEAMNSYRHALALKPNYAEAHSNLLFCLSSDVFVGPQQLYNEHLAFGEQFEAPLRADRQAHNNVKDPARCLQVGFVSGDLCGHAVASFLEPVLVFLAKKQTLSLHAYYTNTREDTVTQRLRAFFPHWNAVAGLSDAELATKIRADSIDILIDLSGHTAFNRLLTFARKPAPIQLSCIGYPATTGLQAMDYRLCDRKWLPPGEFDWQFTEKLAYLPCVSIFQPSPQAPPVNTLPALRHGFITFGSFNRINKLNDSVIVLWSLLLQAVPTARMVLGGIAPESQSDLTQSFARAGITPDRLSFFARSSMADYLAQHHQVDVCLDTFPYNGGTTTAHASWMGVPTLTLAGETPPSRVGARFMSHFGLNGFIASSIEDFVDKGRYWADHLPELAALRPLIRDQFNASEIGQPELFADHLETMLRAMWQRWCQDLPPVSFEIEKKIMD